VGSSKLESDFVAAKGKNAVMFMFNTSRHTCIIEIIECCFTKITGMIRKTHLSLDVFSRTGGHFNCPKSLLYG